MSLGEIVGQIGLGLTLAAGVVVVFWTMWRVLRWVLDRLFGRWAKSLPE